MAFKRRSLTCCRVLKKEIKISTEFVLIFIVVSFPVLLNAVTHMPPELLNEGIVSKVCLSPSVTSKAYEMMHGQPQGQKNHDCSVKH